MSNALLQGTETKKAVSPTVAGSTDFIVHKDAGCVWYRGIHPRATRCAQVPGLHQEYSQYKALADNKFLVTYHKDDGTYITGADDVEVTYEDAVIKGKMRKDMAAKPSVVTVCIEWDVPRKDERIATCYGYVGVMDYLAGIPLQDLVIPQEAKAKEACIKKYLAKMIGLKLDCSKARIVDKTS